MFQDYSRLFPHLTKVKHGKRLPAQRMDWVNDGSAFRRADVPLCRQARSVPTMYDRALQALVKLAMEPEWEARFEENSYGFRPGRSCHDGATRSRVPLTEEPSPPRDSFPSFPSKRVNDPGYI